MIGYKKQKYGSIIYLKPKWWNVWQKLRKWKANYKHKKYLRERT